MLRFRGTLAIAALLLVGAPAHAEGPGIKLGDRLVLHPGVAAEVRWDSNVYFEATNPYSAFIFRALGSIDLATLPPQRGGSSAHAIDFRLHLGADYNEYLSSDSSLTQHRSVGVQAGALMTILPNHPFSIDLFDNFVRTSQPPYGRETFNIDRDTNEVGLRLRLRPGGGRLEFDAMYAFGIDFFEVQQFKDLDTFYHRALVRGSWKFLPKTALYIEVSENPYTYPHPGNTMHPDSYALRAIAGLQGLLTAKLAFNLWVGYGNGFYTSGGSPSTPVAGVEITWRPSVFSTGVLGYRHEFVNSLLGSYYDQDQAYIGWSQQIWRVRGNIKLAYQNNRYQDIPASASLMPATSRTDNYIRLDVNLNYSIKDWLTASIGYDLQSNTTDSTIANGPMFLVPLNYLKHEVWLRLAVLY